MRKIMIQKITQNNWNFWTVNVIMRAKKLLTSRQIFWYAVPARTITKKALVSLPLFQDNLGKLVSADKPAWRHSAIDRGWQSVR